MTGSDDPGNKAATAAVSTAISGTGALMGTLATGGSPAGAFLGSALASGAEAWFRARLDENDTRWMQARFVELEDSCRRLDERVKVLEEAAVAVGKKDQPSAIAKDEIYSDFAREVARAQTDTRREALVNAAARRFDAREGAQAVRKYWFDRVARLNDIQVWVLMELRGGKEVVFIDRTAELHVIKGYDSEPYDISGEEQVAFGTALTTLGREQLTVGTGQTVTEHNSNIPVVKLSAVGEILARYASDADG